MQNAQFIHFAYMAVAILLEVAANIFIKSSQGWRRKHWGVLGIACVLASFTALSQAVKGIELSVAGWLWFRQALARRGCAGIALIVLGVLLLKLA